MSTTITASDFAPISRRGGFDLIDVRTPAEFYEVHAVGALLTPLDSLNPEAVMNARAERRDEPLYVICRSGGRAAQACAQFVRAGFPNVVNIEGGTLAWIEAGLPVNRGTRRVIPLDRQVRIVAGLLTLIGALLVLVSPWFLIVPAFIGAGLLFSGLTGACGMANILARMPWNRSPGPAAGSGACCGGGTC
jgi:rhodanese-related sulfurtransferase